MTLAHAPFVGVEGFYGGLLHPLLVPAHAMAILALGLLISRHASRQRNALSLVFAVGLAAGLAAIAAGSGPTPAGDVVIGAAGLCGLLVALARPWPPVIGGCLAAAAGAAIGLDSPPEVISLRTATVMLIGTGLGGVIFLALIVEGASALTRDWQRIGMRVVGSWIAASAILVLALRFAS
jgi:urease accessory protein